MKRIKLFFPLLLVYLIFIILFSSNELSSDEPQFLEYARNLSNGFYSPKTKIDLVKPPGYPLFLLPFVALNLPLIIPKLFNAIFLFLAVFYFDKTLRLYIDRKNTTIYSYLLGLYIPFFPYIPLLITESLSLFLMCVFIFTFCNMNGRKKQSWHQLLFPALLLSLLAMTRFIFGYVILAGILLFLFFRFVSSSNFATRALVVFILASVLCIPYLLYTYTLTGKLFYWGTNGGSQLYWMSSPYPNEYGDWHMEKDALDQEGSPELYKNHGEFFESIAHLSAFKKDEIFKRKAIENITKYPIKYLQNWLANLGRLVFNYPYSYLPQTLLKYIYIIPNAFLLVIGVLCLYPSWIGRRHTPPSIKYLLVVASVLFMGNSLLSAYPNYFIIIVPIFLLWIAFVINKVITIHILR